MPTYGSYWPQAARKWDAMQRTRKSAADAAALVIVRNKSRYQAIEAKTGVPWFMVGLIHMRESDFNFSTQLGQGDPLGKVSTHVPRGMGPYFGADAFERAAADALSHDGLTNVHDWRLEKILYYLEKYNGWGYANLGLASPYVWAGSDQYRSGKYTSDGHYSASTIDSQLGVAPVLKSIMDVDKSVSPRRETAEGVEDVPPPEPIPEPIPVPPEPELGPPVREVPVMQPFSWATIVPLLLKYGPAVFNLLPILTQIIKDWPKIVAASPEGLGKLDIEQLIKQFGEGK